MKKILLICPYSYPSACGVWTRVWSDAKALQKEGFSVTIFSSDIIKGTHEHSEHFESLEEIPIYRFPVHFSLGGSSMFWFFSKAFKKVDPDIIHTHGYRHPHSLMGLLLGKFRKKKVVLTTHAPFSKDPKRSFFLKVIDVLYDLLVGWWELRQYDRVVRISKWEERYLRKLGLRSSLLIPNGVGMNFFANTPLNKVTSQQPHKKILYMGRIDPVKRLEWIINVAFKLPDYHFKIVGPLNGYQNFDARSTNVEIVTKRYDADDFIANSRSFDIYVLPSVREALPFTLLEAMSQGMIVISSNTLGGEEVIVNGQNGFIVKSENALQDQIVEIYEKWCQMGVLRDEAVKTARHYSEEKSVAELLKMYRLL